MSAIVHTPGLCTTVQDAGRAGHAEQGVAAGGFADARAARIANVLVGNAQEAALLEFCLVGPVLEFTSPTFVAITGADVAATLDGTPVPRCQAVAVPDGSTLDLSRVARGQYGYLAFAGGGLATERILGSRSANLSARLPGLCGRALVEGDDLPLATNTPAVALPAMSVRRAWGEDLSYGFSSSVLVVRAMPGPQESLLSEQGADALWTQAFRASTQANRMGVRLEGSAVELADPLDSLTSQPIVAGAVEVPAGGEPIVMLSDHQTTGGYPVCAVVVTADLGRLAQRRPGQLVRFTKVSVEEAQRALRQDARYLATIEQAIARAAAATSSC